MKKFAERKSRRINGAFPLIIRHRIANGVRQKVGSIAGDISENGIYLKAPRLISLKEPIFCVVRLSVGLSLAFKGRVVRVCEFDQDEKWVWCAVGFYQTRLVR